MGPGEATTWIYLLKTMLVVLPCQRERAGERDEDAGWHAESTRGVPHRMHMALELPAENT